MTGYDYKVKLWIWWNSYQTTIETKDYEAAPPGLWQPKNLSNFFSFFDRFRSLEAEEAFNIACCDEKVQNSILSKDFQHEFSKVCDLESEINFKFYDDSKAAVTKESRKKDKEDKKEAKRLKLLRRFCVAAFLVFIIKTFSSVLMIVCN